jgi:hypothetical protein
VTLVLAILALAALGIQSPALAGGWAVTTFDDLPGEFVAGQNYDLGYTIRQHGKTPINVDRTEIVAYGKSGKTLSFAGRADGPVGHYTATVYFPAEGAYTWQVTQGPFEPQALGTLTVHATPSAGAAGAKPLANPHPAPATGGADPVRAALPFAAAAAAILFVWRLVTILRSARRARATA